MFFKYIFQPQIITAKQSFNQNKLSKKYDRKIQTCRIGNFFNGYSTDFCFGILLRCFKKPHEGNFYRLMASNNITDTGLF
jgi:hypothetical protein